MKVHIIRIPCKAVFNISFAGFIEIKKHYHDILHLMPDNYEQTLHKLQSVITGDETAEILEIVSPDIANKKILDCLIQKMENREHMLDFCEHLEKVIASQNLKTIVSEIKTGNFSIYFPEELKPSVVLVTHMNHAIRSLINNTATAK